MPRIRFHLNWQPTSAGRQAGQLWITYVIGTRVIRRYGRLHA